MTWARLTLFAIHEMVLLVTTFGAVRRKEISDARPAAVDGVQEHLSHRVVQEIDHLPPHATRDPMWMQAGSEQNFVGVNVPDPGDRLLLHQQRFQTSPARPNEPRKVFS